MSTEKIDRFSKDVIGNSQRPHQREALKRGMEEKVIRTLNQLKKSRERLRYW